MVATLHDEGVRHVVIGGVAVAAHGFVRATADVDLVPDPGPDNLRALGSALCGSTPAFHLRAVGRSRTTSTAPSCDREET